MPKKFAITVEKVTGYCACGYEEGDVFICEGLNTPNAPFCGGAYAIIFPMQTALHSGAAFNFEENPHSKTKLTCPDNGYVRFGIALLPEEKQDSAILLNNLDKLHTTKMGVERIRKNLALDVLDIGGWCKAKVAAAQKIERKGKNWYAYVDDAVITVDAHSYTVITARNTKGG